LGAAATAFPDDAAALEEDDDEGRVELAMMNEGIERKEATILSQY